MTIFIALFFIIFCFLKSCLHLGKKFLCPWKNSLLSFRIYNKKIKHFVNPLLISKAIKLWHFWDVFSWPNPNQRNCKSICFRWSWLKFRGFINQMPLVLWLRLLQYLTNLTQVGLFDTLLSSVGLVWFGTFVGMQIMLTQWFENSLRNLVPCLETWTRNTCLPPSYDLFAKDHVW